jgi:hypothetical protein
MIGTRPRRGMALVAVLAVVSLLSILAVATLSVTTRLSQGTALATRDARLDAAASYALATALIEWRKRGLSLLGIGGSQQFHVSVPSSPVSTAVTVIRLDSELFWIVAEAVAVDDARRRENLVVRLSIPRTDSLPPLLVAGDVSLSRFFTVVRDSTPGCAPSATDLMLGRSASLMSADGLPASLTTQRSALAVDSSFLLHIGSLSTATLAASADVILPAGTSTMAPSGVVHATGELTLVGGAGEGVLIVDGRLTLAGPVSFAGLIIARAGIVATSDGAEISGSMRTGPSGTGENSALEILRPFTFRPSVCATQMVLRSAVIPRIVSGRAWAEIY